MTDNYYCPVCPDAKCVHVGYNQEYYHCQWFDLNKGSCAVLSIADALHRLADYAETEQE